jgi:hypothetical protein
MLLLTRTPRPSAETLPVFAPWTHKQRHTISHCNIHYLAEVYCGQNLKHLFRNWISERFHVQMEIDCWSLRSSFNWTEVMKATQQGVRFLVGISEALYFASWRGTHTHSSLSIPLYQCMDVCRLRCNTAMGVQRRVAKPGHVLQAHSFTEVHCTHRRHLNWPHLTKSWERWLE